MAQTLRNHGFDIEARKYTPVKLTWADSLAGCLFPFVLIGGIIIGSLAAPMHAGYLITCLYVVCITGLLLATGWFGLCMINKWIVDPSTKPIQFASVTNTESLSSGIVNEPVDE